MEFDKKTILAFLLIGLILIFLQSDFYKDNFLPPPSPTVEQQPRETVEREQVISPTKEKQHESISPQTIETFQEPVKYQNLVGDGENITVETNLYKAVFSTKGASVVSWELKEYFLSDGPYVQLIGENGQGNLALLVPTEEDTIDTSPFVFSANKKEISLYENDSTDKLEFTLNFDDYKTIKKTYTFYHDRYDVSLLVEFRNFESVVDGSYYLLTWRSGLESTEPDFKEDMRNAKAYAYIGDGKNEFDATNDFDPQQWRGSIDWVAIRTKYFTVAVIPDEVKAEAVKLQAEQIDVGHEEKWKKYGFDLKLLFNNQRVSKNNFKLYFGPLDYDIVKSYNINLEVMMDLGWTLFRPFAKIILWSFNGLRKVIPNYGFIIIIFSILIKIVLYPLTKKSYQSMKAMQNLQPLMQELNEKYKSDAQKKQKETMKLYKEHGVNPLGGCIPMILQMPLLIALFTVFRSTIQLRQAPFIWWITDLSRPDTIALLPFSVPLYGNTVNILPLFMGITMFIQQKISMKDPKQKAMVYMMPIFMTLLFNSFPSGLNLYYALFNLFSIIQEKFIPSKPKVTLEGTSTKTKKRRIKHDYKGRFHK